VAAVDRLEVDVAGMPVRVEAGARELGGDQGQAVFRRGPVELDAGLGVRMAHNPRPGLANAPARGKVFATAAGSCAKRTPSEPSCFPAEDPT
jgi:hypothetical protein